MASCSSSSTSSVPMARRLVGGQHERAQQLAVARRGRRRPASRPPRRAARPGWPRAAPRARPTVKSEIPSSTHAPIDSSGAARRTSASGPAATDGRKAPPAPVVRASSAEPSGTRSSAALSSASATAVGVLRGRRCRRRGAAGAASPDSLGRPPELVDARAEGAGALAQVVEVAVAQRLARLDVEHADGQAARAQREARLGHDPGVGLEVVLAALTSCDDHLGPLAVRAPHDPGAARQPVAGLPVAAQRGAAQAPAAGEVDRRQQPLLARDVVDHRRRGGGGVRRSLERQAQQGGGHAHH